MNLAKLTLSLLLAACTAGASAQALAAPSSAPSAPLPPDLDRVLRDYERAWSAGDVPALAQLFAPEGMALPNGHLPARGADAIRRAYAQAAGMPLSLRALAHATSGDLAYIVGAYSPAQGQPDFGKFVLVLRRQAQGRWLILADIENTNQPLPAPPPARPASK